MVDVLCEGTHRAETWESRMQEANVATITEHGNEPTKKLKWEEPTIQTLDVSETAQNPATGGDGGTIQPDCTMS